MYFGCWSIADAAINVTLLTFQGRSERSAWLRHFDKLADRNGSTGTGQLSRGPTVKVARQVWRKLWTSQAAQANGHQYQAVQLCDYWKTKGNGNRLSQ
jgi:hypothetical protein